VAEVFRILSNTLSSPIYVHIITTTTTTTTTTTIIVIIIIQVSQSCKPV
jgi:hypothetical protein